MTSPARAVPPSRNSDARATPPTGHLHKQPTVLCVDDEMSVLTGLKRVLQSEFDVTTVTNAADALVTLQYGGPFAVIISDFRLLETNGVHLLAQAAEISPDTVRVLLTGQASIEDTIAAVNDGHIFSCIRKPCRPDHLLEIVRTAAKRYVTKLGEHELLEETLHGSIKALIGFLALSCPVAGGRATRLGRYAGDLAVGLGVPEWEVEVAAMVSQIGCAALPPELADRICRGAPLSAHEQEVADRLPFVAEETLAAIPRLEGVRAILRQQNERFDHGGTSIPIGSRILHVVLAYDAYDCRGLDSAQTLTMLRQAGGAFDPQVLDALEQASKLFGVGFDSMEIHLSEVRAGMIFETDVVSPLGILLIARGQEATPALLERIRTHWASFAGRQRVRVVTKGEG